MRKLNRVFVQKCRETNQFSAPTRRRCRLEKLEDRRVLAAYFEREDLFGNDVSVMAYPFTFINEWDGEWTASSGEITAFAGDTSVQSVASGFASAENGMLAQFAGPPLAGGQPVGGPVFIPTVQAAAQVALVANANGLGIPVDAGARGANAMGRGLFNVVDDGPPNGELDFHGTILLAAYGDTALTGDAIDWQTTSVVASIEGFGSVAAGYNGADGTWDVSITTPDTYEEIFGLAGVEQYINFTAPISANATVDIRVSINYGSMGVSSGVSGSANSQWELVTAAWGYLTPSGQDLSPGDVDGDGAVDESDLQIIFDNFGWEPFPEPGVIRGPATRVHGDLNQDGNIDQLDVAIWESSAPSNLILVSTELDENDANYSVGDLSLREALDIANDGDRIIFAPWVDEISLGGSQLVVTEDIILVGPGADYLTVDAGGLSRVFSIDAGVTATISGLTITGGSSTTAGVNGYGGGIRTYGDLTLDSVVVAGNSTSQYGGGVFNHSTGTLTIINSTFDGNVAGSGGGALSGHHRTGEALSIAGSTFSNNSAGYGGGAIWHNSQSGGVSTFTIDNTTFSGNEAPRGGAFYFHTVVGTTVNGTIVNTTIADNTATAHFGGGIANMNHASLTLHNTIVAKNTAVNGTYLDVWGGLSASSTHNLIGQPGGSGLTNNPTVNGNKVGTTGTPIDPLLAPLGDYGGKTKTHALKVGSPAIDAGKGSLTNAYDQRGYEREYDLTTADGIDGFRDIGAYEAGEGTTLIVRSDGDRNDSVDLKTTIDSLRLREALALSAALAGTEVISFDQTGWADDSIDLLSTYGSLVISDDVEIHGPDADKLTIDAHSNSGVISIGSDINVVLRGLRITGGNNSSGTGGGINCGSIFSNTSLTIDGCEIVGNSSVSTGGGLAFVGDALTIRNSSIVGNSAGGNAGGLLAWASNLSIINSTISSNASGSNGGGLYALGFTTARIVNSTIAYNSATLAGGGIYSTTVGLRLDNTIVAANTAPSSPDLYGTFNSSSKNNLIGFDSVTGNGIDDGEDGNLVGGEGMAPPRDALLMPLGNYGGTTLTHALYDGSDAIDAGDNSIAAAFDLDFDQRGLERLVDWYLDSTAQVDIGAVELAIGELYQ